MTDYTGTDRQPERTKYEEYLASYRGAMAPLSYEKWKLVKDPYLGEIKLSPNPKDQIGITKPHDPVNYPQHYTTHPSGIECITITRHMGFNLGNAIKYIWRAEEKGNKIQDLEKAIWYINDEIQKLKKEI